MISSLISLKIYKRPIKIEKKYETGIVVKDNKIIKDKVKIILKGKKYKDKFILKNLDFTEVLNGTVFVDGKQFILESINLQKGTDNLFWGSLCESKNDSYPDYIVFANKDLTKIYLSDDINHECIAAPAKNIYEFNDIKNLMIK